MLDSQVLFYDLITSQCACQRQVKAPSAYRFGSCCALSFPPQSVALRVPIPPSFHHNRTLIDLETRRHRETMSVQSEYTC